MFYGKQTGAFIGRAGLHPGSVDNSNEIILSYAVMPQYWNKGFATEMAKVCISIGFEQLEFESIVCFTQLTNKASQRVIEKNNFKYEKTTQFAHIPVVFYRLTKKDFVSKQ